jgi:hypothetical protein
MTTAPVRPVPPPSSRLTVPTGFERSYVERVGRRDSGAF